MYVIVLKKKSGPPDHLKKWQEKMKRVAPICSQRVKHLRGVKKIQAFNQCIASLMKEGEDGEGEENPLHTRG